MKYDYSKLRGRITEKCGTQKAFAVKIKLGRVSLNKRLNNQLEFTQNEIMDSCRVLGINEEDIPEYFFTQKV